MSFPEWIQVLSPEKKAKDAQSTLKSAGSLNPEALRQVESPDPIYLHKLLTGC